MNSTQALLIAVFYYIGTCTIPFGSMGNWATFNRPLLMGFIVGCILGDPTKGTIIGATINMLFVGLVSTGGTLPSDSGMAGTFGTAFAIVGSLDASSALAIAIPLSALGALFWILDLTLQCFLVDVADKWISKGYDERMILIDFVIPHLFKCVFRIALAFSILYFGSPVINKLISMMSEDVLYALSLVGDIMPAIGIAVLLTVVFNGKSKYFYFLGFLCASLLSANVIQTAFLFAIVGLLYIGFNPNIFKEFASINKEINTYDVLDKGTLIRAWLRWNYFCDTLYNYERMQGIGFVTAMVPILRKTTKTNEEMIGKLKLHAQYFNTSHNFGSAIIGICAAMEEDRYLGTSINDEAFSSLKNSLMGPCAGIGDTIDQVVFLPILSIIFINFSLQGYLWSPIAYSLIFVITYYTVGYKMLMIGYKSGKDAIKKLIKSDLLNKIIEVANIVGCAVAGAMTVTLIKFNWNIVIDGKNAGVFSLQENLFNAIMPSAMPLIIVLLLYSQLKKGRKAWLLIIILMITSFVLGYFKLIC